uniref:Zinc knuckle CX2CX4HX4C domain-containing protein n=1 Tax=Cannabis sativa TaxID=3483 RepID=A0A803PR41_CANSA
MTKDTENRGEGTSMERAEGDPSNVTESSSIVTGEEEVGRKVALAKCFGKLPLPKNRVKQILNGIWVLRGKWWMETLEPGLWGIFFKHEEDLKQNAPVIGAKVGTYVKFDKSDPRIIAWREYLKLMVEIDLTQRIPAGFHLSINRGRKEWVQFKYCKIPLLCFNCGYLFHEEKECWRQKEFAFPPIGEAVQLYGVWIKARSSNLSLNGENAGGDGFSGVAAKDARGPEKGQCSGGEDSTQNRTICTRNRGDNMECQTAIGMVQRSCTAYGDHPMAHVEKNPRDDGVILSLMPNVGPSSAQMLEHPHQKICKSRTPHQYLKPIPVEVELNVCIETTVAHLLGNEVDLKKGETIAIINEGDGLEAHITSGPGQKKRKASIPIILVDSSGKVIHEDGSTNQSNITLPFSPASSPSFAVGKHDEDLSSGKRTKAGGSHGKKKGRRRKDSKTKENPTKGGTRKGDINQMAQVEDGKGRTLVDVEIQQDFHVDKEAALTMPPNLNDYPIVELPRSGQGRGNTSLKGLDK